MLNHFDIHNLVELCYFIITLVEQVIGFMMRIRPLGLHNLLVQFGNAAKVGINGNNRVVNLIIDFTTLLIKELPQFIELGYDGLGTAQQFLAGSRIGRVTGHGIDTVKKRLDGWPDTHRAICQHIIELRNLATIGGQQCPLAFIVNKLTVQKRVISTTNGIHRNTTAQKTVTR